MGFLLERWEQVKAGQGQVVLLSGDASIGKSRLVQVLKEHVAHEPHMRWECRSSEYYQNTALFPLVDLFQRILRFAASETPDAKLAKLAHTLRQYRLPLEESISLFAPLLSLPIPEDRYPPLNLSPQRQRQKNAGIHCRDPVGTGRATAGALYPGRFTLDGPHDSRIIEPGDRADTNRFCIGAAHVSPPFSTCLASPVVSHGDHSQPLITYPSGTDRYMHDRWENLTTRGTPAAH
jgi:hypothetical protein